MGKRIPTRRGSLPYRHGRKWKRKLNGTPRLGNDNTGRIFVSVHIALSFSLRLNFSWYFLEYTTKMERQYRLYFKHERKIGVCLVTSTLTACCLTFMNEPQYNCYPHKNNTVAIEPKYVSINGHELLWPFNSIDESWKYTRLTSIDLNLGIHNNYFSDNSSFYSYSRTEGEIPAAMTWHVSCVHSSLILLGFACFMNTRLERTVM